MNVGARTAGEAELAMILDWARTEGWNPGLDDAPPFWAADPQGYFLAEVDGRFLPPLSSPLRHGSLAAYLDYRALAIGFIEARNQRIQDWWRTHRLAKTDSPPTVQREP